MRVIRYKASRWVSEPQQALAELKDLTQRGFNPRSVGGKGYHTKEFVEGCCDLEIAPHVSVVSDRKTPGLDGRTIRSSAYKASQKMRKRIEEIFWMGQTHRCVSEDSLQGLPANQPKWSARRHNLQFDPDGRIATGSRRGVKPRGFLVPGSRGRAQNPVAGGAK